MYNFISIGSEVLDPRGVEFPTLPLTVWMALTTVLRTNVLHCEHVRLTCVFNKLMMMMMMMMMMSVFTHVCGQKADNLSNCCDNIQPYDNRRFNFCQMWHDFLDSFFQKLLTFTRYCDYILNVWWEVLGLYEFCWTFTFLPSSERLWKSVKNWQSYRHQFGVLVFWDTVCLHRVPNVLCTKISTSPAIRAASRIVEVDGGRLELSKSGQVVFH